MCGVHVKPYKLSQDAVHIRVPKSCLKVEDRTCIFNAITVRKNTHLSARSASCFLITSLSTSLHCAGTNHDYPSPYHRLCSCGHLFGCQFTRHRTATLTQALKDQAQRNMHYPGITIHCLLSGPRYGPMSKVCILSKIPESRRWHYSNSRSLLHHH